MAKLTFKEELCKGCGLCVTACPKKILAISKTKLNHKGHAPVELVSRLRNYCREVGKDGASGGSAPHLRN